MCYQGVASDRPEQNVCDREKKQINVRKAREKKIIGAGCHVMAAHSINIVGRWRSRLNGQHKYVHVHVVM